MNKFSCLIKKFPRLYRHGVLFECGPGWYAILHDLSELQDKIEWAKQLLEEYGYDVIMK